MLYLPAPKPAGRAYFTNSRVATHFFDTIRRPEKWIKFVERGYVVGWSSLP